MDRQRVNGQYFRVIRVKAVKELNPLCRDPIEKFHEVSSKSINNDMVRHCVP
jgi:hypothetical protein